MSGTLFDEYLQVVADLKQARDAVERAEGRRNCVIEQAYDEGLSAVQLAEIFGLSRQMIHRIVKGERR